MQIIDFNFDPVPKFWPTMRCLLLQVKFEAEIFRYLLHFHHSPNVCIFQNGNTGEEKRAGVEVLSQSIRAMATILPDIAEERFQKSCFLMK
jgi:hypothetical protein